LISPSPDENIGARETLASRAPFGLYATPVTKPL
jgi:hypothetical protein